MLEVRRVRKTYASIPAVDGVSFSARAGEITVMVTLGLD
jgi:ABC-type multidrug transport system ATPase subunit